MARTVKRTTTTTSTRGTTKPAATNVTEKVDTPKPVAEKKEKFKVIEFDPNQTVVVKNGFQGKLVYISKRTGQRYIWENPGDEQDMEISELRNAKNNAKGFFIDNYFQFDDPEVIEYLGVQQYYKYALKIEDFDTIFEKTPEEIKKIISDLSDGQKKSVAYRARKLIASGDIDSNRVIKALEEALDTALVDRGDPEL